MSGLLGWTRMEDNMGKGTYIHVCVTGSLLYSRNWHKAVSELYFKFKKRRSMSIVNLIHNIVREDSTPVIRYGKSAAESSAQWLTVYESRHWKDRKAQCN